MIPLRQPAFDAPAAKEMPFLLDVMPLAVGGPQFIPSLGPLLSLCSERERDLFRLSLCMPGRYEKKKKQVYTVPPVGEENEEEGGAKK